MRRVPVRILCCLMLLALCRFVTAQAAYTATGPGERFTVGATGSIYQADYGQRYLGGITIFSDANLSSRSGLEAEYRKLNMHTDAKTTETTYLIGPRVRTYRGPLEPYVKVLGGIGHFNFPYNYATGNYAVIAPGAGLDLRIGDSLTWRVVDAEYQIWPGFTYGTLKPYGISTGISIRIF